MNSVGSQSFSFLMGRTEKKFLPCTGRKGAGAWLESGCVLKVKLIAFPDRLALRCEEKAEVKQNFEALGLSGCKQNDPGTSVSGASSFQRLYK